ncbi:phosphoserine phosphatase 1 [Ferrovum sp. JA12]|uniref:histidine phosphatase family protein n=1 Tax=Ferrovum sp. JA12 TaxID=1356299 RepID=UPI00070291EE|nr:histidine phosphatase family protein [Ferrovum sp. JA12]KRH79052.1 phosphoserine phosphatase 1 [Ferrovum sp. JA12]HQU08107.1 histidine phosphatase family protein [Candidatus Paceibacterota bacterium]
MDVILIRHGQSRANQDGLLISNETDDLTELGRQQSQALAMHMRNTISQAQFLYSSTWQRALSTAEIVFAERFGDAQLDSRITETSAGKHGSWLEEDFNRTYPDFYSDLSRRYEGGESHKDMSLRVIDWVDSIILSRAQQSGLLVCVTHGGPISVMLQYLMGMPFESRYPSFTVPNASYTKLHWRIDLRRFCLVCMGVTR